MISAVEFRAVSKRFGSVLANSDIHLKVETGTIHAIIGENGAGKSTAMKMLYGIERPDSGEIWVENQSRKWRSPADAISYGIGMVHQHFMLAEPYDALENILLGAQVSSLKNIFSPIDRAKAIQKLKEISDRYGLKVPFDAPVETLSIGVRQRIEILKLLYRNARILILDEPTAVLTPQETADLFLNLRKLKEEGKTILIITHKLKEVMAISDHVTVFRGGRVVAQVETSTTCVDELASLMVGRKIDSSEGSELLNQSLGQAVLEVSRLSLSSPAGSKLQDIDLQVRSGEVVGIAGVEGNGQSELLQVLLHPKEFARSLTGDVRFLGHDWKVGSSYRSTMEIKDLGVGVIPEDRHRDGLLLGQSVTESFLLGLQRKSAFAKTGLILRKALERAVLRIAGEYDVRPNGVPLLSTCAGALSGGNQQKIIIAREFERKPQLLIAAHPTRGVDVGAIEFIHRKIIQARNEGMGILLISSELDELLALSDRILVMYEGRIVASFRRGEVDEKALGLAMGGALGR